MKALLTLSVLFFFLGCGRNELVQAPPATDGVDVGNGGDTFAGEFVEIGYELAELLTQQPMPGVTAEEILKAVRGTKVVSSETLELDQKPIDALNFPDAKPPRIDLNRTAWKRMRFERHQKVFLALHEYLGILGIKDENYQVSRRLDRSGVCERTAVIRLFLENEVRKSCYRIAIDDLRFIFAIDLSKKEIQSIKPGDFDHLVQLKKLYLNGNELTHLPNGLFRDLSELEELRLGQNKISQIEPHAFQGLSGLKALGLYGNALTTLPAFAFEGIEVQKVASAVFPDVSYIDIGQNSFETIQAGAFQGITAEHVMLSSFKNAEAGAFEGLTVTNWLAVGFNPRQGKISPETFRGVVATDKVSVEIYGPDLIPASFFAPLTDVKELRLAAWHTAFTKEQMAVIDKLPALETLDLTSYLQDSTEMKDLPSSLPSFECKTSYGSSHECTKLKAPAVLETVPATPR